MYEVIEISGMGDFFCVIIIDLWIVVTCRLEWGRKRFIGLGGDDYILFFFFVLVLG